MTLTQLHSIFLESNGVCTDTRALKQGQLFMALKGDNFNGNTYALDAIDKGALYAVVDEQITEHPKLIQVKEVLATLQQLATFHRRYLNIPIIALTGSNGKTTTKELIHAVLSQTYRATATKGNLNNHIGVPLTLLSMDTQTQVGIVEMGANHQDEIALLARIAQPNYGYITNFGKAHLEGFGGIEGVIKGKSELYDFLRDEKGTLLINSNDPLQLKQAKDGKKYTFGSSESDCLVSIEAATPFVRLNYQGIAISTQLIGQYNGTNAAAAVAFGQLFKVPLQKIKVGLTHYIPKNNRSQIIERNGIVIILDAYNANPTSMEAALTNLAAQKHSHKIVFLGDMFEVGATTLEEHENILNLCTQLGVEKGFAVGPTFGSIQNVSNVETFSDFDQFSKSFKYAIPRDSAILIKGSRGMRMERVLDLLPS